MTDYLVSGAGDSSYDDTYIDQGPDVGNWGVGTGAHYYIGNANGHCLEIYSNNEWGLFPAYRTSGTNDSVYVGRPTGFTGLPLAAPTTMPDAATWTVTGSGTAPAPTVTVAGGGGGTYTLSGAVSAGSATSTGLLDFPETLTGAAFAGAATSAGILHYGFTLLGTASAGAATSTGILARARTLTAAAFAGSATSAGQIIFGSRTLSGSGLSGAASCAGTFITTAPGPAVTYTVQRATDSGFTTGVVTLASGLTVTSYADPMTTADNGITYYYRVIAVFRDGTTNPSAPVAIVTVCVLCPPGGGGDCVCVEFVQDTAPCNSFVPDTGACVAFVMDKSC